MLNVHTSTILCVTTIDQYPERIHIASKPPERVLKLSIIYIIINAV